MQRIVCRVPHRGVDAVQNAAHLIGAHPEQAVEAHSGFGLHDLHGVGRRYGRDPVGELQPCFQEADRAIMLDAVPGERSGRQAKRHHQLRRKLALEGQIVHGHDRARRGLAAVVHIGRGKAGLPIVHVHHIGLEGPEASQARCRRRPCQAPRSDRRYPASRCHPARYKGCPAGRRDRARRGRKG